MNILLIFLLVSLLFGGGAGYHYGGPYVGSGFGLVLIILILFLVLR